MNERMKVASNNILLKSKKSFQDNYNLQKQSKKKLPPAPPPFRVPLNGV